MGEHGFTVTKLAGSGLLETDIDLSSKIGQRRLPFLFATFEEPESLLYHVARGTESSRSHALSNEGVELRWQRHGEL